MDDLAGVLVLGAAHKTRMAMFREVRKMLQMSIVAGKVLVPAKDDLVRNSRAA